MIGKNGVSLLIGHNGVQDKTTLNPANETVARGIYDATILSAVDAELAAGNIKDGVTIFGFVGTLVEGTDISDADATVGDVKDGKFFYSVAEPRKEGTMPTAALSPDNSNYPAGYHAGEVGGLVDVDAQLVTGSIKFGITIFGVAGHTNVRDSSDADAAVGDVKSPKTFYAGGGARKTGTIPTKAIVAGNDLYEAGYHTGNPGGLDAIDTDLTGANIKYGKTIFGKAGSTNVRDTTDANATAVRVRSGYTFYAGGGARKTGTLATRTLSHLNDIVAAGYYAATTLHAVDADLATGNIKSGKTIFGFVGTVMPGAYPGLTVADFQLNAATGTFGAFPQHVNDNNTGSLAIAWTIGQYAEINLGGAFKLTQFRHYGAVANNGDGSWKIQYYDIAGSSWEDWVTGIATRATADWSNWDSSGGEISTNKIRLVCTAVDTGSGGQSNIAELEVKF